MMKTIKKKWVNLVFVMFSFIKGQELALPDLQRDIFLNNQRGEQDKSQNQLLTILKSNSISIRERVFLNLLLANTYRSLNDYPTTVFYLEKSSKLMVTLPEDDSLRMRVYCELAYNYFDHNQYEKSKQVMIPIVRKDFLNIDLEDVAYIKMQLGYLDYLDGDFKAAKQRYDESLKIIKQTVPRHMPVILVKKMQLFAHLDKNDSVKALYNQSISIAKKYKILKYELYATEEIAKIYKSKNYAQEALFYQKVLDSLQSRYNLSNRLSKIHLSNNRIIEQQMRDSAYKLKVRYFLLFFIFFCCSIITIIVLKKKLFNRKKQKQDVLPFDTEDSCHAEDSQNFSFKDPNQDNLPSTTQIDTCIDTEDSFHKEDSPNALALDTIQENLPSLVQIDEAIEQESSTCMVNLGYIENLSERQIEILSLLKEGFSNKEVAERLCISINTVKYHLSNIYITLNIENRTDLLLKISNIKKDQNEI